MKILRFFTLMLLTAGISVSIFAQEEGSVQVKVITSCNGNVVTTDTTYSVGDGDEIQTILNQLQVNMPECEGLADSILQDVFVNLTMDGENIDFNGENINVMVLGEDGNVDINLDSLLGSLKIETVGDDKVITKKIIMSGNSKSEEIIEIIDGETVAAEVMKMIQVTEQDGEVSITINGEEIDLNGEGVQLIECDENTQVFQVTEGEGDVIVSTKICVIELSDEDVEVLEKSGISTDLENTVEIENFEFYPNPNDGKFKLRFKADERNDVNIRVIDAAGREVYQEKLANFQGEYNKTLDISSHEKGTYFLHVGQGEKSVTRKLIVK